MKIVKSEYKLTNAINNFYNERNEILSLKTLPATRFKIKYTFTELLNVP